MLLAELCCQFSSLQAQLSWCKTKMQGGGIRGVQLGKCKMKSGSHQTPSVCTHKNTPKNQLKAQVQHEYSCCAIFSVWWLQNWTGNKTQRPRLHFSVSFLPVIGAQELPQELWDICLSSSTLPIWILQISHKNKQPGSFGRESSSLAQRRAETQHHPGVHPYPGFCLGSPRAAGALCVLGSPFPLPPLAPLPLGAALPMPVVSREHSLV